MRRASALSCTLLHPLGARRHCFAWARGRDRSMRRLSSCATIIPSRTAIATVSHFRLFLGSRSFASGRAAHAPASGIGLPGCARKPSRARRTPVVLRLEVLASGPSPRCDSALNISHQWPMLREPEIALMTRATLYAIALSLAGTMALAQETAPAAPEGQSSFGAMVPQKAKEPSLPRVWTPRIPPAPVAVARRVPPPSQSGGPAYIVNLNDSPLVVAPVPAPPPTAANASPRR
jgi:hypothetical protein